MSRRCTSSRGNATCSEAGGGTIGAGGRSDSGVGARDPMKTGGGGGGCCGRRDRGGRRGADVVSGDWGCCAGGSRRGSGTRVGGGRPRSASTSWTGREGSAVGGRSPVADSSVDDGRAVEGAGDSGGHGGGSGSDP